MVKYKIISAGSITFLFLAIFNVSISHAYSISGAVTAQNSGTPIEGLWVDAYDYSTGTLAGSAKTRSDGSYTITDMSNGSYRVHIPDSESSDYVGEYYNNTYDYDSAATVKVTSQNVSGINFALEKGGQISGKVDDSRGTPIKGLSVYAYDYSTGDKTGFAYTESDGSYEIKLLHPGTYRVHVKAGGANYLEEYYNNAYDYGSAVAVEVSAGQTTSGKNIVLKPGEVVIKSDGVITATFSRAMDPKTVNTSTFLVSGGTGYGLRTIAGRVTYSGMTATFTPAETLDSTKGYRVMVTAGVKDLTGQPLQHDYILTSATNSIYGKVIGKSSGMPVQGMNVYAVNNSAGTLSGPAKTESDGSYVITDLTFGSYKVYTENSQNYLGKYYDNTYDSGSATAVQVTSAQQTSGTDFFLDQGEVVIEVGDNLNAPVTATFSELMNDSTINADTFFITTGKAYSFNTIAGNITYKGKVATFVPASALNKAAKYLVTVTTGAKAIDGTPLQHDYEYRFSMGCLRLDITKDGNVDLGDAVRVLQILAGSGTSPGVSEETDVNRNYKIGLEEAVYILQKISGLRNGD